MSTLVRITISAAIVCLLNSCKHKSAGNDTGDNRLNSFADKNSQLGRKIFEARCLKCHRSTQKDGSQFDKIFERLPEPSEKYFTDFIADSKALKDAGDDYAKSLDSEYPSEYEHKFADSLSQEDFKNIIVYLKQKGK